MNGDRVLRRLVGPPLRAWLRLDVTGAEQVPAEGPCLVASTHTSHADNVALGVGLGRPVHFLGTAALLDTPVLGRFLTDLGMVPVRRGSADLEAMAAIRRLLDDGEAVVVYPEGSRSRDGRVHRPRSGVARLAAATGAPVVPAAVVGSRDVWPVGERPRLRGGRVAVRVGRPLDAPRDRPADRRHFQHHLHDVLVELSGAERVDAFAPAGGEVAA